MSRNPTPLAAVLLPAILATSAWTAPAVSQDPGTTEGDEGSRAFEARISPEGAQAGYGELVVLGPGARLRVETRGESEGMGFAPSLDGRTVSFEAWSSGWEPGRHRASGTALTTDGEKIPLAPLEIVFDPTAPRIEHQIGGLELLEQYGLDQGVEAERPERVERHRAVAVYWSADGRRWLPVLPPDREEFDWIITGDEPQVFLWTAEDGVLSPPDGTPIGGELVVRLWASDELSAVRSLLLSATPETLEVQARDLVGNRAGETWALSN